MNSGKNQHLSSELKRRNFELELLYKVSDAISYSLSYEDLVGMIMESLAKAIPYDLATAFLTVPEPSIYVYTHSQVPMQATEHSKRQVLEAFRMMASREVPLETCRVTLKRLHRLQTKSAARPKPGPQSFFNVPLLAGETIIGMINVSRLSRFPFDEADARFLTTLANQMTSAIQRVQELVASEQNKMQLLVANMTEGVIMLDEKEDIVIFNPQAKRLLGLDEHAKWSFEAVRQLPWLQLEEALTRAEAEGRPAQMDVEPPAPLPARVLRLELSLIIQKQKKVGTILVLRDRTQEKAVQDMQENFISEVSHELRTPLTMIHEGITQIKEGLLGEVNDQQKKFLAIAIEGVNRLNRLVNDFLDLSKLEQKRAHLAPQLTDLVAMTREVVHAASFEAHRKSLEIREHYSKESMPIYIDKDKMIQVFTNLIGNALKYTPQGHLEIAIEDFPNHVECRFQDTGLGISQEDLPFIFNKFTQFTRKETKTGTGLGLVIVKAIIDLHQGSIRVESTRMKGTTFTVTLPKLPVRQVLENYLREGIQKASRDKSAYSVILFFVEAADKGPDAVSPRKLPEIVRELAQVTRPELRRKGDLALEGSCVLLVLLPSTSKENAALIAHRLKNCLMDHLRQKNLKGVSLDFEIGTYPENYELEKTVLRQRGI